MGYPTRGFGERRKLPQLGPGGAPAENDFSALKVSQNASRMSIKRKTSLKINLYARTMHITVV